MDVLITGGTGFVGAYVAEGLLEKGANIMILDAFPDPDVVKRLSSHAEIIPGSILDQEKLLDIIRKKRVENIIHLASLRNTDSQERPVDAFYLNCQGTLNVLEAGRKAGLRRVVFASSVAVCGNCDFYRALGLDPFYLDEDAPTNPGNFYGATKLFNEQMGVQYKDIFDLDSIGIRLTIIIGPGKKTGSQTSELNDIIEKPILGQPVRIRTFNDQVINLIHVRDSAQALIKATYSPATKWRIFNVGGQNVTIREIAAEMKNQVPGANIELIESREERKAASAVNIDRARSGLGYGPQFPLPKAIEDYMNVMAQA